MKRARVLIVEDDAATRALLERALTAAGHSPRSAASVAEAARRLDEGPADMILLDLVLPDATGFQALPGLKSASGAVVVVMSGLDDADTRDDALLLGAAAFFPKPVDLAALLNFVDSLPAAN